MGKPEIAIEFKGQGIGRGERRVSRIMPRKAEMKNIPSKGNDKGLQHIKANILEAANARS